jgi:hypothetical protein
MEDWQEMLIIILVVLIGISVYFVYLGDQMAGLKQSISSYSSTQGAISGSQGQSQGTSPYNNAFSGILGPFGG